VTLPDGTPTEALPDSGRLSQRQPDTPYYAVGGQSTEQQQARPQSMQRSQKPIKLRDALEFRVACST
jgi:hypothetical protein